MLHEPHPLILRFINSQINPFNYLISSVEEILRKHGYIQPISSRYRFVEKMARDGILAAPSASVINEWFAWAITNVIPPADLIVYLRTSPEVVYHRIHERNRKEEKTVSLQYLREMHENWLYHKTMFSCPAPVLTLNADLDKSAITEEYQKIEPSIFNTSIDVCS